MTPLECRIRPRHWLAAVLLSFSLMLPAPADDAPQDQKAAQSAPENLKTRWDFNRWQDIEGWTIPAAAKGLVTGGALWLEIQPAETNIDLATMMNQLYPKPYDLHSPKRLNIPGRQFNKLRMRIRNLSPETEGVLFWRFASAPDQDAGGMRFTMKPYETQWQEVVAHIDGAWEAGIIDQLRLQPAKYARCGDIYIDWIAFTREPFRIKPPKPDVRSDRVVPSINLPGVTQADIQEACNILDECLWHDVPILGFEYPFQGPGGAYGECWWQLDTSLALAASKWLNQSFAEGVMRNFQDNQSQNGDGRIDLYGGQATHGLPSDQSSLPRYFEVACDVARRTHDVQLREAIYQSMRSYLDWWLSPVKRDPETGLISAIFEETFGMHHETPQTLAPIDTNVAVAIGAANVADLARRLGKTQEAMQAQAEFESLRLAINTYLWDDTRGYYCNYDLKKKERYPNLICTTMDPLRLNIAPAERIERLLPKLLDPQSFNWGKVAITSVAMTDPTYREAVGPYDGSAWFGDVWTLRNLTIILGLSDIGRHDLAGDLAWQTVKIFNRKWCEYLKVSDGSAHGVARYAWTASQWLQAIIEGIFGIDYDSMQQRLRIAPRLPEELKGQPLSIEKLLLPAPGQPRLNLAVGEDSAGVRQVKMNIEGALPTGTMLEVLMPVGQANSTYEAFDLATGQKLKLSGHFDGIKNVVGVRLPATAALQIEFRPTATTK